MELLGSIRAAMGFGQSLLATPRGRPTAASTAMREWDGSCVRRWAWMPAQVGLYNDCYVLY